MVDGQPSFGLDAAQRAAILAGDHDNPFGALGPQKVKGGWVVRAYLPGAESLRVVALKSGKDLGSLFPEGDGFFVGSPRKTRPPLYRLEAAGGGGDWSVIDAYQFGPVLGDLDEYFLAEGSHFQLWDVLGAHVRDVEGVSGVHFAVWAPNAKRVSVVGDFNDWDGRRHGMRRRGSTGVWETFIPDLGDGARYKFEVKSRWGGIQLKADPLGFGGELRPGNCSIVRDLSGHDWQDADWMHERWMHHRTDRPISIYEVHLGSWRRHHDEGNRPYSYRELADSLIPYVKDLGFTHIEVMPISEHPFDGSWGYQPIGLFAPTARHGTAEDFRAFVEAAHAAGIGVLMDWVPAHFPVDDHGLGRFDGTPLYEHADPREGFHPDWNTLIYNYGRREVQNYLIANALYWLSEHHLDGLRVDAVASMLYRDYSRKEGQWIPNEHGGRENLEAIAFLKRLNEVAYGADASIMTVAEESTAWPGVSKPTDTGGLGFGYKWNMGWMNDSLAYMGRDPIHRVHHHGEMTFSLLYSFSENFVLPLSHDEVVHGKGSILGRMPGNDWERFANLRAYYAFMWGHPGKKLLFMGCEFAQSSEWNADWGPAWGETLNPKHEGARALVRDLNRLYVELPALHQRDCRPDGFDWVIGDAASESVFAWLRWGEEGSAPVLCLYNMTPVERRQWRIGVPQAGFWREVLNTDAEAYGGGGRGNFGGVASEPQPSHGRDQSIEITLPPLAGLMFTLAVD